MSRSGLSFVLAWVGLSAALRARVRYEATTRCTHGCALILPLPTTTVVRRLWEDRHEHNDLDAAGAVAGEGAAAADMGKRRLHGHRLAHRAGQRAARGRRGPACRMAGS